MTAPKVIIIGSLDGQIEAGFTKIAALHAKNHFSFGLVTGNLFAEDEPTDDDTEPVAPENTAAASEIATAKTIEALQNGTIPVPFPIYYTVGDRPLPTAVVSVIEAGDDLCPNLYFLGKRSITKTLDGIRIATLGGLLDNRQATGRNRSEDDHQPFHTSQDAHSLYQRKSKAIGDHHQVDILLTTVWPDGIWRNSKINIPIPTGENLDSIPKTHDVAKLSAHLRPRYHFVPSPSAFFYQREPFLQPPPTNDELDSGASTHVTRFLSIAPFGNDAKAKALYAFTLPLSSAPSSEIPPDATPSPFQNSQKRTSSDAVPDAKPRGKRQKHGGTHAAAPQLDQCFFCLSNPKVAVHMCCCIGTDSYLALAKGPLTTTSTFQEQQFELPAHYLIIPLSHVPTIQSIPEEPDSSASSTNLSQAALRTFDEMTRFRHALESMVTSQSAGHMGVVTWEISRGRNFHAHWQTLAVPSLLIRGGLVETAFRVEAEQKQFPNFQEEDGSQLVDPEEGDYFRVWIGSASSKSEESNGDDQDSVAKDASSDRKELCLRMPLSPQVHFEIQFARRVLAKLLALESRFQWQECTQTEEEETQEAESFRKAFKPWDFTLETE